MSNNFVMGDMHLGHRNIVKFRGPQLVHIDPTATDSLPAYHEFLVRKWNDLIGKNDTVYILGDFCFDKQAAWDVVHRLNGRKKLIGGNHDYVPANEMLLAGIDDYRGAYEYKGAILTHIPIHPEEARFYKFNVHGHCHNGVDYGRFYFNAVPELWGYQPIPWGFVEKHMAQKRELLEKLQ